jgi:hypothetical protein
MRKRNKKDRKRLMLTIKPMLKQLLKMFLPKRVKHLIQLPLNRMKKTPRKLQKPLLLKTTHKRHKKKKLLRLRKRPSLSQKDKFLLM